MTDLLFYVLATAAVISAVAVVLMQNPIYSALTLAITMISVAGIFFNLGAYFLAAVQLIVYAGAVLVLFVMVLMLFDLKHEMKTFSKGLFSGALKLISVGLLLGLIAGSIWMSADTVFQMAAPPTDPSLQMDATRALAKSLFTTYLFGFEAIGVLLLIIAIGAVTLSRITGGTHADS